MKTKIFTIVTCLVAGISLNAIKAQAEIYNPMDEERMAKAIKEAKAKPQDQDKKLKIFNLSDLAVFSKKAAYFKIDFVVADGSVDKNTDTKLKRLERLTSLPGYVGYEGSGKTEIAKNATK